MTTSVVIPTRNEAQNVRALLARLCPVIAPDDEILFVDDGSDDLPELVAAEAVRYSQRVGVHRRIAGGGGLAGAVVEGIRRTRGEHIVVCDGDLQHPPEVIPDVPAHERAIDQRHFGVIYLSMTTVNGQAVHKYLISHATPYILTEKVPRYLRGELVGSWLLFTPRVGG